AILAPRDPEESLHIGVRSLVVKDRLIRNALDQTSAKDGSGDAEDCVVGGQCRRKVRLAEGAAHGIRSTRYREQGVNTPVSRAVWVPHEADFAHRSVGPDERQQI